MFECKWYIFFCAKILEYGEKRLRFISYCNMQMRFGESRGNTHGQLEVATGEYAVEDQLNASVLQWWQETASRGRLR